MIFHCHSIVFEGVISLDPRHLKRKGCLTVLPGSQRFFFFSGGGVCFLFVLATPHPHLWYRIHLNVCRALKRSCVAIRADASPTVRRFQQENPVMLQFFPHWLETPCNHLYTYAAYAFLGVIEWSSMTPIWNNQPGFLIIVPIDKGKQHCPYSTRFQQVDF